MQLDLPKPVVAYFTADKADGEAVAQCFIETARGHRRGAHLSRPSGDQAMEGQDIGQISVHVRAVSLANARTGKLWSLAVSPATSRQSAESSVLL